MKMKPRPIARLEQFVQGGRTITYMFEFMGKREYPGHVGSSYAIFNIYDKKKRTKLRKFFDFGSYRKAVGRTLIANQNNLTNTLK